MATCTARAFSTSSTNPKLLDLAESLLGPEIIASSVYRLRPKVPGFAHGVVPWHQDSGYFEPYCDEELVLTMWIPLVEATPERGCLRVMRRAHTNGVVPHRRATDGTGYLEIPKPHLPLSDVVTVPVSLGGVLLLTNRTPHCSGDNVTDVIRWSVDIRYQSADLPTNYDSPSGWTNQELPHDAPIACYPPEADFLVRSRRRPGDVVRDPDDIFADTSEARGESSDGSLGLGERAASHAPQSFPSLVSASSRATPRHQPAGNGL